MSEAGESGVCHTHQCMHCLRFWGCRRHGCRDYETLCCEPCYRLVHQKRDPKAEDG